MVKFVILIWTISMILSWEDNIKNRPDKKCIYSVILLGIILVLIATFRSSAMPDWENYYNSFYFVSDLRFEPAFQLISTTIYSLNQSFITLLFVMALIGVSIKLWSILKLTNLIWSSIMVYISNIFILHDMIQIRAAIASGILLVALYYKIHKKLSYFIMCSIIAVMFHYSAIIIFPIWFIKLNNIDQKKYLLLIPLGYVISISGLNISKIFSYIPIAEIQMLLRIYSNSFDTHINVLNAMQLSRCIICVIFWIKVRKLATIQPAIILFLKIYTIGLFIFVALSDLPVAAFRISELLLIVEIILLPYIAFTFINKNIIYGKLVVASISMVFLLFNIFINQYLT